MGEKVTNIHLHDDEDQLTATAAEEAEEALSLRDFALDLDSNNDLEKMPDRSRRSSSSVEADAAPEFFEFLSDFSADMCPADDIIFCGKLVPLKQRPLCFQTQKGSYPFDNRERPTKKTHVLLKRSESLSELQNCSITCSDGPKNSANKVLRSSRSLDYQKLHRLKMERNPSVKSVGKLEVSPKKAVKPRWYLFMFGMVKFPPEMELKDIKSRQFRNAPSVEDGGKKPAGKWSSGKVASWNLLKALSCRDHTSVAVTASSFWMPPESNQA